MRAATAEPFEAGIARPVGARRAVPVLILLTMLISPFVSIEPAPYEAMTLLLAVAWMVSGPRLDRRLVPLIGFFVVWIVGASAAVIPVLDDSRATISYLVSLYLQATAIIFAGLFSQETEARVAVMAKGYLAAGAIAAALGIAGYFNLFPGADALTEYGRAKATFKDPNVYGPFLILPLLLLVQDVLLRGLRMRHVMLGGMMLVGLLLSFSRGAWIAFGEAAAIMVGLMVLTAASAAQRRRIVLMALGAIAAVAILIAGLLAFDAVGSMFEQRASLVQDYDGGALGRFGRQAAAATLILTHPNGIGPAQFAKLFPEEPHQVYLTVMISHGWIGGIAYLATVIATIVAMARAVFLPTRWQAVLIACYAAFIGIVLEGFVVDTDHWRHYYLLLGLTWGLGIASFRAHERRGLSTAG